ncbi:hypothetical protein AXF42_Ash008504 [Apostasia shenzhenica]|uniref:Rho GTPase-activating protein 3 n=1 Tax=Apostasia shenzhenica TaxID=1088818 RepID=A0A2I0AY31_9ASPA|nr:hypothetical protein AXF42_Ash008504 [Apostasia shenzhenica]
MARFPLHIAIPSFSLFSHQASVDEAGYEEIESESWCGDDLISSPLIVPAKESGGWDEKAGRGGQQYSILATVASALRKSLVMCSLGAGEEGPRAAMDIGCPTDVRHVAHVTFDRFDGFLGLPVEFQPEIPSRVPSASASVFGVSAESMQCSHDARGNSVPTILLSMQRHLYARGGLQAEGIFRINAENGQEIPVREQLNQGIVPCEVDMHCLAGLIKAWFRELPNGILDSLTPEQVMHCNTEEDCSQLVQILPPTEAALLDWAINLMADVVEHEHHNKMNARNIAMVFAPNMTQMADPLTALVHAVQVMNFLKTLITKTLREREDAVAQNRQLHPCSSSGKDDDLDFTKVTETSCMDVDGGTSISGVSNAVSFGHFLFSSADSSDSDAYESFQSFEKRSEFEGIEFVSGKCSPAIGYFDFTKDGSKCENGKREGEGLFDRLNLRKGVQKLCSRPVFQLSRSTRKAGDMDLVISG